MPGAPVQGQRPWSEQPRENRPVRPAPVQHGGGEIVGGTMYGINEHRHEEYRHNEFHGDVRFYGRQEEFNHEFLGRGGRWCPGEWRRGGEWREHDYRVSNFAAALIGLGVAAEFIAVVANRNAYVPVYAQQAPDLDPNFLLAQNTQGLLLNARNALGNASFALRSGDVQGARVFQYQAAQITNAMSMKTPYELWAQVGPRQTRLQYIEARLALGIRGPEFNLLWNERNNLRTDLSILGPAYTQAISRMPPPLPPPPPPPQPTLEVPAPALMTAPPGAPPPASAPVPVDSNQG